MSKKDYVMIAQAINEVVTKYTTEGDDFHVIAEVQTHIANKLAQDNARFDRERFATYCLQGAKGKKL